MTSEPELPAGARIGVFGKGGAGKSTVVVLLARALQARGARVCVLDADSTNFGLAQALGFAEAPAELLELFGGMVFRGGRVTCPVDDPTPLPGAALSLAELPPRYRADDGRGLSLLVAGKLPAHGTGAGCDGPIIKIARDLRIRDGDPAPVTLIDSKAGFEDPARGAVTGIDLAVVVADPTRAAIHLAIDMRDLIDRIHRGDLPATAHLADPQLVELANAAYRDAAIRGLAVVLNKVPDAATERAVRAELARAGIEPVASLPVSAAVQRGWLRGEALEIADLMPAGARILDRLARLAAAPAGR
jgi:CO dehydrogenase nickel-insertion accessory protein CooC1